MEKRQTSKLTSIFEDYNNSARKDAEGSGLFTKPTIDDILIPLLNKYGYETKFDEEEAKKIDKQQAEALKEAQKQLDEKQK